jgi:hypothetical protein
MRSDMLSDATKDFSLVSGGPVYQLLLRVGLVKPPFDRVAWRMIVITLVAWAPLLLLTALGGRLMNGVKIPFFFDIEVHCRLLVTLPLLVGAEVTIHRRIRLLILQFVDRQIVTSTETSKFEDIVRSALRLRDSMFVELALLAVVVLGGRLFWTSVLAASSDTWYALANPGGAALTPAGYWYESVSVRIVQFVLLRWYYRLFIWGRLLWQVSRMNLRLVPSHPDGCCGLGFLGQITYAVGPFLIANSVLLAGFLANRILNEGARLPDYTIEIVAVALFLCLLALGPLCVFVPRLLQQRQRGLYSYGPLASEYVIEFEKKWIEGQRPENEPLVGSADIQSLADLANSFAVVQRVRPFPFGREAIVALAFFIALPLLPLSLTMFSFQEIVSRLLNVLL